MLDSSEYFYKNKTPSFDSAVLSKAGAGIWSETCSEPPGIYCFYLMLRLLDSRANRRRSVSFEFLSVVASAIGEA